MRVKELLIYGSCDGDPPGILSDSMLRQMEVRDGRTYWVGPKHLVGASLVLHIKEAQANLEVAMRSPPKPPA